MSTLMSWDRYLSGLLNNQWHTPWLDWLMPYWRDQSFWIPLYFAAFVAVVYQFRLRGLLWALALVSTVAVSDVTSSQLVKKTVQRLRPCNDPVYRGEVKLLITCGSGYSFTSSHATNHFAMAVFTILTLGRQYRRLRWPLLGWAGSIALAQVYVGVHYLADVCAGALLGTCIAWLSSRVHRYFWRIPAP